MNKKTRNTLVIISLIALLCSAWFILSGSRSVIDSMHANTETSRERPKVEPTHTGAMQKIVNELGLSSAQKQSLDSVMNEIHEEVADIRLDSKLSSSEKKQKTMEVMQQRIEKFKKILTDEQRKRFDEIASLQMGGPSSGH